MESIRISRAVPAKLEALGIAPAEILRRARLPQNLLQQERIIITIEQWFAIWNVFDSLNTDPALGLKLTRFEGSDPFDALWITALSAPSFHAALTKIARYKKLFTSEDIILKQDGNMWNIEVAWFATKAPTPPLLIDMAFGCFVNLGKRGTGWMLKPERVQFRRAEQHRAMYEDFFQCPIAFNAEADTVFYSHETMMQPFTTYNPDLLAMLEPQLDAELEDVAKKPLLNQVKALVRNRLAGQQPAMLDIAQELHMSVRTLQRRLAAEGMSFQQVLETVRHELAQHYLKESTLELNEIAFLLGYQEANSFHRAFNTWEGRSPGQWRAAQQSTPQHLPRVIQQA